VGAAGFDDFAMIPPPAWAPRTVVEYVAPEAWRYAYPPSVVVIREAMRELDSLGLLVDRQIDHVATLPGGRILRRTELPVDGLPAMELAYEWNGTTTRIQQVTTLVESICDGRRVVTSITTVAASADAIVLAPLFFEMMASVRIAARAISDVVPAPDSEPTLQALDMTPFSPEYAPPFIDVPMPDDLPRRREG
jgi:hypothetical protein